MGVQFHGISFRVVVSLANDLRHNRQARIWGSEMQLRSRVGLIVVLVGTLLMPSMLVLGSAARATQGASKLQIAPAIPLRPVGLEPEGFNETFFGRTVIADMDRGPGRDVALASSGSAPTPIWVDDVLDIVVTHPDGTRETFSHDFSNGCSGTITPNLVNLTNILLRPGRHYLAISLRDKCGGVIGSTPIWISGNGKFSIPATFSGPPGSRFPKPGRWNLPGRNDCAAFSPGAVRLDFNGPARFGEDRVAGSLTVYSVNAFCGASRVDISLQRRDCGFFGCSWKTIDDFDQLRIPANGGVHSPILRAKRKAGSHTYRMQADFSHPEIDREGRWAYIHYPGTTIFSHEVRIS